MLVQDTEAENYTRIAVLWRKSIYLQYQETPSPKREKKHTKVSLAYIFYSGKPSLLEWDLFLNQRLSAVKST